MKDVERGRVNLHSVLNCLISLWACEMGGERAERGCGGGGGGEKGGRTTHLINWIAASLFCYVHFPCETNDGLDCLKFPSCSLDQTQGLNEYRRLSSRPWARSLQTI